MMIVFSKQWFKKYNKQLCWLANSFIGDWVFSISKMGHDKKKYGKIFEMYPNAINHKQRLLYNFEKKEFEQEYTTQFFSRNEYALRLQKIFYPIWFTFHCWDMLIANRFKPAWNLGFDTLTVYPAVGANSPVDGFVAEFSTDLTWANIIIAAGSLSSATGGSAFVNLISSSSTNNQWAHLYRGIFLFDTSPLTADANISATVLSLYGYSKTDGLSITPDVNVYTSNPANNDALVNGDFTTLGSVAQCDTAITYANQNAAGYNDFTFNATGRGNVSKTGISKFGARNANYDVAANAPSWSDSLSSGLSIRYADNGSDKPKLVVTYTTVTTNTKTIQAKARVKQPDISKTVQAKGRVKQDGIDKTVQAKARIQHTLAKTITSKAKIGTTVEQTIQAKATIKQFGVAQTVQSKADIKHPDIEKTIQAKARVQQTPVKTIQVKADIKKFGVDRTIQSKADIKKFGVDKTIKAKAAIKQAGLTKTATVKARLKQLGIVKTITAKANLWAFRAGYVKMRSRDQEYPITLNSDKDFNKLRSMDQEYPKTLEDNRIL